MEETPMPDAPLDDFLAHKYKTEIAAAQERVRHLTTTPTSNKVKDERNAKWFRDMCLMACAQLLHERAKLKDVKKHHHHHQHITRFKAMYQQRLQTPKKCSMAFLQKMAFFASKYMEETATTASASSPHDNNDDALCFLRE
jgi:hypothetical protein